MHNALTTDKFLDCKLLVPIQWIELSKYSTEAFQPYLITDHSLFLDWILNTSSKAKILSEIPVTSKSAFIEYLKSLVVWLLPLKHFYMETGSDMRSIWAIC